MTEIKVGDLVFLPSDVTLLKEVRGHKKKFCKTSNPSHVLVIATEESELYYTVLYDGKKWEALKREVYPIINKEVSSYGS